MLSTALRILITILLVSIAVVCGILMWNYYLYYPWTRDGRIRAQIITIAPDVSGWVTKINFSDNSDVKSGQVLFEIDSVRFRNAVEEAKAKMGKAKYSWEHAKEQYARRVNLLSSSAISKDDFSTFKNNVNLAEADYELNKSNYDKAMIDLHRTQVISPVDGSIMNQNLRIGNYVTQGKSVLSIVRRNSMYVTAYFEETKLQDVSIGSAAKIKLMGSGVILYGQVISIAKAISNNNTSTDNELLPTTQQTFNWVRLAQRIPVDIKITSIPENVVLSSGMTVSVEVTPRK